MNFHHFLGSAAWRAACSNALWATAIYLFVQQLLVFEGKAMKPYVGFQIKERQGYLTGRKGKAFLAKDKLLMKKVTKMKK